jgi:short-subunit dehydrogenase
VTDEGAPTDKGFVAQHERPEPVATALVTGASSGIGAATAKALARRGTTVGLVARRADRLEEVAAECRTTAPLSRAWRADLSDPLGAAELAVQIWDELGPLDVIVHNAGIPLRRTADRLTMAEVNSVMTVNYFSPVAMTLALLPRLLERGRGTIVNVSSLGGRLGIAGEAAYSASKFALVGWSESLAADLLGTGVAVRLVLPGPIDTEIWDQPGNDPAPFTGSFEPPELVADGIIDAIASDRFEHYLPDLRAVVEMKTKDFEGFVAGMRAMRDAAAGPAPGPPES